MRSTTRLRRRLSALLSLIVAAGVLLPVLASPASAARPPWDPREFESIIDGYAAYDGQKTCYSYAQPGMAAFRSMVLAAYPYTRSSGITRACGVGGRSEHKEGRAWDWAVNVTKPAERAAADQLIAWLLETDGFGYLHSRARRLGIMYIVWNRRIWRSYRPEAGWLAYSGASAHTDHVHFSMSWDGALKRTTWWGKHQVDYTKAGTESLNVPRSSGEYSASAIYRGGAHVFNRAADGNGEGGVEHQWYHPGNSEWFDETLDPGFSTGEDATALTYGGQLHLFGKQADGRGVRHLWWNPGTSSWWSESLDGAWSAGAHSGAMEYGGQLHIVGASRDGRGIRHLWWNPWTGSWWQETLDAGGSTGRHVTLQIYSGQFHIFNEGPAGGIRHLWWNPKTGTWWNETLDRGASTGQHVDTAIFAKQLHMFSEAVNTQGLRHLWWNPVTGSWWSEILDAGSSAGTHVSTLTYNGELQVFNDAATGGTRHLWWDPGKGSWSVLTQDSGDSNGEHLDSVQYGNQLHLFGDRRGGDGTRHVWFN